MSSSPFQLRILGPNELTGPDHEAADSVVRQPKRLALLAYLALTTADGFRRRDKVIALFWPEIDQAQARTYLRKALFGISEALDAHVIVTRGEDEVRLDSTRLWCDAVALQQLRAEGRCHEALALYRGDMLEGLFPEGVAQEFHEWLDGQRRVLREHAAAAAWECARVEEERGDRKAAAVMARRALELTPDDEVGVRRLMSLLDGHGDRAGALRVYSEWQARLQEEYGVEPAPETRKLARRIQAARKGESHETPRTSAVPVPVTSDAPPAPSLEGAPPSQFRNAWRLWVRLSAAIVIGALALAIVYARYGSGSVRLGSASVAVLPFRSFGDAGQRDEAERVTEELNNSLSQLRGLTVRSAARAQDVVMNDSGVDQIGRHLGVAYMVDGAVQRGVSLLRVTVRLVRVADGVSVWAGSYDEAVTDPIASARRVAERASREIAARLTNQ